MSYNVLATTKEYTVVTEYTPEKQNVTTYQSEDSLEKEFISRLQTQGYEYIQIHEENDLISNLKKQLEILNNIQFEDDEWEDFFKTYISNNNLGIIEKTRIIQQDFIKTYKFKNGISQNIKLIDKEKPHNNKLQVINQYEVNNTTRKNRYDVTILINGFPLVHIELKRRGVPIKEAFNQIDRYQRESFWSNCGLYEYVQIFVISNGTHTKYYSNTTRKSYLEYKGRQLSKNGSKSFEFTSYWADQNNVPITDLVDFTKTFFAKNTLLNVLTKYCIFTTNEDLMVLRPYQIAAVEKIINTIIVSSNYKTYGTKDGGGYIWHTTGSGKTLSSFVTAQRGTKLDDIDKVFFVVDRKDLDSQTIQEYEKFQKGAVNGNSTTKQLQEQIESDKEDKKIIVTTIQKLGIFIKNNKHHPIFNKHVVIIFDECHRSQFGELHNSITNSFKKYHIFGFTGTPIYPKNDMKGKITEKEKHIQTTENVFGKKLHSYTIIDAIRDDNVLPFSIDYVNTFKIKDDIKDKDISSIDKEKVLLDPIRIANNVSYILENYNAKTKRYETYFSNSKRMNGFNSILCCDSIKMAMMYYNEFKKQIEEKQKINPNYNMKIATIFSYAPNSEEEQFDTSGLSQSHRDFLDNALNDYNNYFEPKTNFNTSSDKNDGFYEYYLHLTKQIKKKEIDIVIVVNMLLTGFDSPMTNTLWVDKQLEMHNLIQAFSRTNRILNSIKSYGKIVCFRDLRNEVDDALALYGDKDASGIVILRSYDEYMNGFTDNNNKYHKGYIDLINELKDKFELPYNLSGSEKKDKEFIKLFGIILRLMNILESFDDFKKDNEKLLSTRDYQNYRSSYLDLKDKYTTRAKNEKEFINDDIEFETELIEQVSINIDYILNLIEKYHKSNCEDKEIIATINTAINSSVELRSKKDLIEEFYNNLNINIDSIGEEWIGFLKEKKEKDLLEIIKNENLKEKETIEFVENCFKNGSVKITGTSINDIMPPITRFGKTNRNEKKNKVISLLEDFFEKYHNLFIY